MTTRMRQQLCSELAAEFGAVWCTLESTAPESNGVVTCNCWTGGWSISINCRPPHQLIVGDAPDCQPGRTTDLGSGGALKRQGKDWFSTLLLPEALSLIPAAIAPLLRRWSTGHSRWPPAWTQLG